MHSDDAVDRLGALLREAGVDLERPTSEDVERTWAVMRVFAGVRAIGAVPHALRISYGDV